MKLYKNIEDFKTIKEMLETRAITHKDLPAIYQKNGDQTFLKKSFSELKADIDGLGTSLLSYNLQGKKIAIIGKNSYDWIVSYFAVTCGLGVVVPLDKQLTKAELVKNISRLDIEALLYADDLKPTIEKVSKGVDIKQYIKFSELSSLIESGKELIDYGDNSYKNIKVDDETLSALIFTSGTTSEPKIVMQSNKNMMSVVNAGRQMVKFNKKDKFFSVLPLNHTFESVCGLLAPLASGSSIVYTTDSSKMAKDIKESAPTAVAAVPKVTDIFYNKITKGVKEQGKEELVAKMMKLLDRFGKYGYPIKRMVFKQIHDQFGGNLRLLVVGGAPVKPIIVKYFKGLGIQTVQGYGLTECSPLVTLNGDKNFDDETAGMATPGTELVIDKPNEEGVGEILVKGPQVTAGYYNDEKATKELLKDGYLHTGDLGKLTKDNFVKILGRIKNIIITSNGKNISPEEIEDIINSLPEVKESLVYEETSQKGRTLVAAKVVVSDNYQEQFIEDPNKMLELQQKLKKLQQKQLSRDKYVERFIITLEELPKTATQKIKRMYNPDLVESTE